MRLSKWRKYNPQVTRTIKWIENIGVTSWRSETPTGMTYGLQIRIVEPDIDDGKRLRIEFTEEEVRQLIKNWNLS